MPKIIITLEVSETMFQAIEEKFPNSAKSSLGNICISASTIESTVQDKYRIAALELISLAENQIKKEAAL